MLGHGCESAGVEIIYYGYRTGIMLIDDGKHNDEAPGDCIYGNTIYFPPGRESVKLLLQFLGYRGMEYSNLWPYLAVGF